MSTDRVGQEIAGKYRLVRLLGEGGMGQVYEAQHTVIGRRVAIKFLRAASAGSRDMLARFRREAQAAGSLESENIAAVTDFGSAEDGAPYIVMEYLTGEDLSRLLSREGPMPVPRIVDILIQACRGLHSAHGAGIVHRDLKPENLFIARRGDGSDLVKVLDFGIAKLRKVEGDTTATETGTTMGTPYYMPPEQARGEKDIDHRADVYSLGVILYEALSGVKPHPGESYNAILYHILSKPPAPLESLRPGLPEGLAAIVHRALAFDASDRQGGVAELMDALVPYAARAVTPIQFSPAPESASSSKAITVDTPPSVVGERVPTEFAPTERQPTPGQAVPTKSANTGLLAGLAVGVVVVVVSAVLVSRSGSPDALPAASVSAVAVVMAPPTPPIPSTEVVPSSEPPPNLSAPTPAALAGPLPRQTMRAPIRSVADHATASPSAPPPVAAFGKSAPAPSGTAGKPSVKTFIGDRL